MDWVNTIELAVDYIENNLDVELDIEIVAKSQYTSSHQFQKMFTLLCNCTVGEYIRNRKLTKAGFDLVSCDESILNIALKYGYQSNESFTRAFTRFHGTTPSSIRKGKSTLNSFTRISVKSKLSGGKIMVNDLSKRGYIVKETGAVYYTKDMDKAVKWFEDVLGWYGQIESRDTNNNGNYGCVNNIPLEIDALNIAPFTGIHLFYGEPIKRIIGFMLVQGIDELYDYVNKSGWSLISKVFEEPWGGKTCEVTTIDGSILKFFEL